MKYLVEVKPAKGWERTSGKYTYELFTDSIISQARALGLEFKITEDSRFVSQSDDWNKT